MVKESHEIIINAFFRIASRNPDIYNISLSDIAEEAGISRQAIYNKHFSSVNEIFIEIHEMIDSKIFNTFEEALKNNREKSIYEIIASVLIPLIYEHRVWLKILYNTSIDPSWREFLTKKYCKIYIKYTQPNIKEGLFLNTEKTVKLNCEYILSLISIWLSEDFPILPSVFSKEFLKIMNSSPSEVLQKFLE